MEKYPITENVFKYMRKNDVLFHKTLDYITGHFGEEYFVFCEELLRVLKQKCATDNNFTKSLNAVIKFSREFLLLQTRLNMEGTYVHSSFKEVNNSVYQSEKMNEYYLDGLFLTQILWPNHYKIISFFLKQQDITDPSSLLLDVACGAGTYTYHTARAFDYEHLEVIDISPHSVAYTRDILRCSSLDDEKVNLEVSDIYEFENREKFDFIVCSELLEHVEDPAHLLNKLESILKDGGRIFLTTAIYAAEIDHICLFNNVGEVRKLIMKNFQMISELILPTSLEEFKPDMDKVPINYACVLRKR